MKILHVQKIAGIAGSEKYLLEILPALKTAGVEVHFLALVDYNHGKTAHHRFLDSLRLQNITCHTLRIEPRFWLLLPGRVVDLVKKQRFDLIHTHLIHADFLFGALAQLFKLPKVVSTKHGYDEWYNNAHGFKVASGFSNTYHKLARFAERGIFRSYAISQGLKNLYVGLGICNLAKIEKINYGFDIPIPESKASLRRAKYQLVMVGRLVEFKGHRYAFEALKMLVQDFKDVKLLVVGDGPIKEQLINLTHSLGLERSIIFMGHQPNAAEIMASSDVVLTPSISEGFGVVILEAFAAKKPIVAFNVPAFNEHIKTGYNGILVEPYNTMRYAEAIKKLLQDEQCSKSTGLEGFNTLKHKYALNNMLTKTLGFYKQVLTTPKLRLFCMATFFQNTSPSQRFRFEQYFDYLFYHGVEVRYSTFFKYGDLNDIRLNHLGIRQLWTLFYRSMQRMCSGFKLARYNVLFIHREGLPNGWTGPVPLAKWLGLKVIYDFDDAIYLAYAKKQLKNWWGEAKLHFDRHLNQSDLIIAGNSYLAKEARKGNGKVVVIPTTIDTINLHNQQKSYADLDQKTTIIGWTGSHTTLRFLYQLLPVFQQLEDAGLHFKLLVICNEKPKWDFSNFEFVQWDAYTEIQDLLRIDIGIMPLPITDWSNGKCGLKVLQFMSLGITAVASNIGVNPSIIAQEKNGFLCTTDEEWFNTLKQLILGQFDLRKIGQNAQETIKNTYAAPIGAELFYRQLTQL